MGVIKNLLTSIGRGIAGPAMNWVDEALYGNKRRKQQIEQQQKLTDMQIEAQKELANYGMGISKELFEYTGYAAQKRQMEEAGLNPALMYGHAGAGGTTMGLSAGNVSGSQASDETSRKIANIQMQGMGLQMQKLNAEIQKTKAEAEKAQAEAKKVAEESETISQKRQFEIELLKQQGTASWIQNLREKIKNEGELTENEIRLFRNPVYGTTSFQKTGYWNQEVTTNIAKALAETENQEAQAALTNEKTKGYWNELLNATKNADSEAVKAAAMKLAAEWSTGEYTNWRTWVDIGSDAVNAIAKTITPFK